MRESVHLRLGDGVPAASGTIYSVIQKLGSGGNATTYLVWATGGKYKGVPFAMKVFRATSKPERRENFLDEVRFLRTCEHPSVMRVYDEGVLRRDHPFVVAEYLPATLEAIIRSDNTTTVTKLSYALQLLAAIHYLSTLARPVLHRDIKPQNIFVKGHSCVLGDFGLMKFIGGASADDLDRFKESAGAGMPQLYRTPDLVAYLKHGTPPTVKSDVYQLGLVLAELFAGENPQKPSSDFKSAVKLKPLGTIPGALAPSIANLINEMLNEDHKARKGAAFFLDAWNGLLMGAAKRSWELEGRVF